ncbi:exopolyphosphatase / guanosine-5'-triphosphate,3'-diphosphate pyrophosphatase [Acidocella aminolytica 101 = DSM 11237]|uniref:Exopolyphosphatase n=2 Tax=Acidocella TaxID=50709 RepID=A0A0D6PFM1_9PROT|nr:exopolyphosphatase [Acidocella aminolytica 101 = DSM 11237]GBQ40538.1 exopolyphosphatase [Acidocella aminolytica 101 = DSM 11237]SHF08702.1 exopolyphosphatase / guanosine-5'-triphosphate,3'-diphosphate pyrophosphatase [Acidocella aminolytica 101 = DSM 11237]
MDQMIQAGQQSHPIFRRAVVDLGSNSVRLVIYEGELRNPMQIFNEKAVLRLAKGMTSTGRLKEEALVQAETVLHRYAAIARAMGAGQVDVLATSAVRDAVNGQEFVEAMMKRLPDLRISILSGEQEAVYSAEGVLCGIPGADGMLADLGGGSLELIRLEAGKVGQAATLPVGVIRLADQAGEDIGRARAVMDEALSGVAFTSEAAGKDLYLSGGAFRALARIHIAQTGYPLNIVHHYTINRDEARDLAGVVSEGGRKLIERMPGVPRRRIEDLPYAAVILRRLLRATGAARVVFSANGLREGWFSRLLPPTIRAEDPLLAASRDLVRGMVRDANLPRALVSWTAPLFANETHGQKRLREAACWLSDIGSHEHPEYRAEQAFMRVLRQAGMSLDHHARAFLALATAVRYEAQAEAGFLAPARALLDMQAAKRAETLGTALRLAYTLSAGTPHLLAGTALTLQPGRLVLGLDEANGVFAGDAVLRRLERLALMLGREAETLIKS